MQCAAMCIVTKTMLWCPIYMLKWWIQGCLGAARMLNMVETRGATLRRQPNWPIKPTNGSNNKQQHDHRIPIDSSESHSKRWGQLILLS